MPLTKEQQAKLRDSPEFRAAMETAGDRVVPDLECFRDGAIIADYPCRLTIGRLALLSISQSKIFADNLPEDYIPTPRDFLGAIYLLCDDYFEDVVKEAENIKELDKHIQKFADGFSPKETLRAVTELTEWLQRISEIMGESGGDEPGNDPDWWVDAVDLIASQYHWTDHYILWTLPLVRADRYQQAIVARKTGRRRIPRIRKEVTDALDIMKKVLHGQSETMG